MARRTIFDKLGGAGNVRAAVDKFYEKILADPSISHFFSSIDMKKQKAKQFQMMSLVFGGPNEYKGRDMYTAHKHLPLTDAHFDAVAGHFVSTLNELGVEKAVVEEATAVVASTRGQVLGREKPPGAAP
ncbi:hypothetical protein Rsub_07429 [Raphidocelis subcapitata]|uniref:Group 1 truncated hemoglobin n=1 Tax=Raphidocelis subcapitata TaxID=307507 RepID=A0A2V0P9W4_9CHLO|nr:hypothetical protein Rsub_07429 [Raphidocelis subcapitata]|eukprot:GBF94693.1 hypothetical protein Rsub_07429 [Raphidocelis subcapitata]